MKKTFKGIISLCLVLTVVFSFCACKNNKAQDGSYVLKNGKAVSEAKHNVPLNPEEIYGKITYIPEMFFGTYIMVADETEMQEYIETSDYMDFYGDASLMLTKIPCGLHTTTNETAFDTGIYPMTLSFKTADGVSSTLDCTYTVKGKKLICKFVDSFEYDGTNSISACNYNGKEIQYDFEFSGAVLKLSVGGKSVELVSDMFSKEPASFYLDCYAASSYDTLDGMRHIEFNWSGDGDTHISIENSYGEAYGKLSAVINKNGQFSINMQTSEGRKTLNFVYFFASPESLVLTDGEKTYVYTGNWFNEYRKNLIDNLSDEEVEKLKDLSGAELEAVIAKKKELISDISKAFSDMGINVVIDKASGEISMDSSVLFGGDSADISKDGEQLLKKAAKAYADVIFTEKYENFVSSLTVAGHTAPVEGSSYEDDLPLSKVRAFNVKKFCTSEKTGLDEETLAKLSKIMEAVGMSNSKPVLDKDGNVDYAASRRVTFHLTIKLETQ